MVTQEATEVVLEGADPTGVEDSTDAIQRAIDRAAAQPSYASQPNDTASPPEAD